MGIRDSLLLRSPWKGALMFRSPPPQPFEDLGQNLGQDPVPYNPPPAHETVLKLVFRLSLEKKKKQRTATTVTTIYN